MTADGDGSSREAAPGPGEGEEGFGRRIFLKRLSAAAAGSAAVSLAPGAAGAAVGDGATDGSSTAGTSGGARPGGASTESPFSRPVPLPPPSEVAYDDPYELSLAEAASLIRDGRLSPVELVESFLERIEAHDEIYRAFNTVVADAARERARDLEKAPWRGPLHGIPLALKDNYYTAGVPTTANSRIFEDFVPEFDATATRRLLGAGGILLGKTEMGPLATSRATTPEGDYTTYNAWAPHDIEVSPGGSSSGSATATAARMAAACTGTQTGGSITRPSDRQGLTGLKPTMGRVSLYGIIPLTYTRDHPGPLARDARDAAIMLQAMAGPDPSDPRTQGLPSPPDYVTAAQPARRNGRTRIRKPTTVGIVPGYLDPDELVDEEEDEELSEEERRERERRRRSARAEVAARGRMIQTFEELGARVVEIEYPEGWDTLTDWTFNNVRLPERSEPFMNVLRRDVREFGVSLSPWINGLLLSGTEYLRGQRAKLLLARRVLDEMFGDCDIVAQKGPFAFDSIGLPLISFPIGFEDESIGFPRPIGALFGARPYREDRLLSLAGAYQAVTDFHSRHPEDPDAFPLDERSEGQGEDESASVPRMDPRDVMRYGE